MPTSIALLSWTHPVHGRVTEAACPQHLHRVQGALAVLGIGHTVIDDAAASCDRCRWLAMGERTGDAVAALGFIAAVEAHLRDQAT